MSKTLVVYDSVYGNTEKIAGRLKKGGVEAAAPGAFFVKGTEGPLADGELERAAAWAGSLVEKLGP